MTNDNKLGAHIAGLLLALHELPPRLQILVLRKASIPNITDLPDIERWATQCKAMLDETLSNVYARISLHADAIMQLTDDERTTMLVRKLAKMTTAEITDQRDVTTHLETVSDAADLLAWTLKWAGGALGALLRRNQIVAATAELENYYRSAA